MPLTKKRSDKSDGTPRFYVYSGDAAIGTITALKDGRWMWAIETFRHKPSDPSGGAGVLHDPEAALAAIADRWRQWLSWAGLTEA